MLPQALRIRRSARCSFFIRRVVMLPKSARAELQRQLAWRRQLHEKDVAAGLARVALPDALARKYPRAAQEFGWQFLFASRQRSRDPKTGDIGRHHIDPGSLARAVTLARTRAGLLHRVGCHTLRMASAYYYTFQRMAYFQRNSGWSGDVLGSWRP